MKSKYAVYQLYLRGDGPQLRVFVSYYPSLSEARDKTTEISTEWEIVEITERAVAHSNPKTVAEKRRNIMEYA